MKLNSVKKGLGQCKVTKHHGREKPLKRLRNTDKLPLKKHMKVMSEWTSPAHEVVEEVAQKRSSKHSQKVKHSDETPTTVETKETLKHKQNAKKLEQQIEAFINHHMPNETLLVTPESSWREQLIEETPSPLHISLECKTKLKNFASCLYEKELEIYNNFYSHYNSRDSKLRSTLLKVGTHKDRLATHVLQCAGAALHALSSFKEVIEFINEQSKLTTDAISHILILIDGSYLGPNGFAREFSQHSFVVLEPMLLDHPKEAEKQILIWFFEDQLLQLLRLFVQKLVETSRCDKDDKLKKEALNALRTLAVQYPQFEPHLVLGGLTKRLGDSSNHYASTVLKFLSGIVCMNPQSKGLVVNLVHNELAREDAHKHTIQYGLCLLRELSVKNVDDETAGHLIEIFFGFFKSCLTKGELNNKLLLYILRGLYHLVPSLNLEKLKMIEERLNVIYIVVREAEFSIAVRAVELLHVLLRQPNPTCLPAKYHICLYKMIKDPDMRKTTAWSTLPYFFNLLYRVIRDDILVTRTKAFIKRLLQYALYAAPHITLAILYIFSSAVFKNLARDQRRMYLYPRDQLTVKIESDAVETRSGDKDSADMDIQFTDDNFSADEEEFAAHKKKKKNPNKISREEREKALKQYRTKFESFLKGKEAMDTCKQKCENVAHDSGLMHGGRIQKFKKRPEDIDMAPDGGSSANLDYNIGGGDPSFAKADLAFMWELLYLKKHFHPAVAAHAGELMEGNVLKISGDPLDDCSIFVFLTRYVSGVKASDAKERKGRLHPVVDGLFRVLSSGQNSVLGPNFSQKPEAKVPKDDIFLHRYYSKYTEPLKQDRRSIEERKDAFFEDYIKKTEGRLANFDLFRGMEKARKSRKRGEDDDFDLDVSDASGDDEADLMPKGKEGADEEHNDLPSSAEDDDDFESDDDDDLSFDEEAVDFSDKSWTQKKTKNPKLKDFVENTFVSSDKFDDIIEGNKIVTGREGTAEDIGYEDHIHPKQRMWEAANFDEDDFQSSRGWKRKRGGRTESRWKSVTEIPERRKGIGIKKWKVKVLHSFEGSRAQVLHNKQKRTKKRMGGDGDWKIMGI